jgi:CheY-like chemotaxis protein
LTPESNAPSETYAVSCFNCGALFDALEATWCNCVVSKRSLVCPSCLNCFCKALPIYKRHFWEAAPKSLWEKSLAEHKGDFEPPPNPNPLEITRPLVLVVDDEKDIQRMTLRVIEGLGYGVILARDGEEGLELARKYHPDLVLTDAFMPKMDGREMCLRIKEDPATAKIKVVVMTSLYTEVRYKYEAFRQFKADDYLTKPLEFRQLQALFVKHLG